MRIRIFNIFLLDCAPQFCFELVLDDQFACSCDLVVYISWGARSLSFELLCLLYCLYLDELKDEKPFWLTQYSMVHYATSSRV